MLVSNLVALTALWYAVHSFPGVIESVGYLFGIFIAGFTIDAYMQNNRE